MQRRASALAPLARKCQGADVLGRGAKPRAVQAAGLRAPVFFSRCWLRRDGMRPFGGIDGDRVAGGEGLVESLVESVFGCFTGRRRVGLRLGHVILRIGCRGVRIAQTCRRRPPGRSAIPLDHAASPAGRSTPAHGRPQVSGACPLNDVKCALHAARCDVRQSACRARPHGATDILELALGWLVLGVSRTVCTGRIRVAR